MGTRSIIRVVDENSGTLVTLYNQYDGYPSGVGAMIYDILGSLEMVNRVHLVADWNNLMNGLGDTARILISQMPSCRIVPSDGTNFHQEYEYILYCGPKVFDNSMDYLKLTIIETYSLRVMFDGFLSEFPEFLVKIEQD